MALAERFERRRDRRFSPGIQCRGCLIQEQDGWLTQQRPGDRQALPLAP